MELQPFEIGADRYQPEPDNNNANDPIRRDTQKRLAALIGYVALFMPIALGIGGLILSLFDLGEFRRSLSGFYYEEVLLGDIFVGCLIFIGAALFAYRGWHTKIHTLACVAGVFAFLVALFPADGWKLVEEQSTVFENQSDLIHLVAAVALFLILAWFCFFVFTKVRPDQRKADETLIETKRTRNMVYKASGATILAALVAMGLVEFFFPDISIRWRVLYWGETIALLAFGVSWMVHGRAYSALSDPRDLQDREAANKPVC